MTHPLPIAVAELADVLGQVRPDQQGLPTPCGEFDVAGLRQHVLSWVPVFTSALEDPEGTGLRPDPAARTAPAGAAEAAAELRDCARRAGAALDGGVTEQKIRLFGDQPLPGMVVVGMFAGEIAAHGWDLARATGQPWHPAPSVCEAALAALRGMLAPEYRGPGQAFGHEIALPDGANALERLLAFTGRDPAWAPPA